MTWLQDLSPCAYFETDPSVPLVAIGWLAPDHAYATGKSDPEFYGRLVDLCHHPFEPVVMMGVHACELCQFDGHESASNLWVPAGDCIYVCPTLITHYIACHHYLPPPEFVDAVSNCPDTSSMQYKRLFLESGGRALLRQSTDSHNEERQ